MEYEDDFDENEDSEGEKTSVKILEYENDFEENEVSEGKEHSVKENKKEFVQYENDFLLDDDDDDLEIPDFPSDNNGKMATNNLTEENMYLYKEYFDMQTSDQLDNISLASIDIIQDHLAPKMTVVNSMDRTSDIARLDHIDKKIEQPERHIDTTIHDSSPSSKNVIEQPEQGYSMTEDVATSTKFHDKSDVSIKKQSKIISDSLNKDDVKSTASSRSLIRNKIDEARNFMKSSCSGGLLQDSSASKLHRAGILERPKSGGVERRPISELHQVGSLERPKSGGVARRPISANKGRTNRPLKLDDISCIHSKDILCINSKAKEVITIIEDLMNVMVENAQNELQEALKLLSKLHRVNLMDLRRENPDKVRYTILHHKALERYEVAKLELIRYYSTLCEKMETRKLQKIEFVESITNRAITSLKHAMKYPRPVHATVTNVHISNDCLPHMVILKQTYKKYASVIRNLYEDRNNLKILIKCEIATENKTMTRASSKKESSLVKSTNGVVFDDCISSVTKCHTVESVRRFIWNEAGFTVPDECSRHEDLRPSNDAPKNKLVSNNNGNKDAKKRAENFLLASVQEGVPVKACRAIAGVNSPNNRGGEAGVGVEDSFMRPSSVLKPKESHRQHCLVEILGRNIDLLEKPLQQKVDERKNGEECTEDEKKKDHKMKRKGRKKKGLAKFFNIAATSSSTSSLAALPLKSDVYLKYDLRSPFQQKRLDDESTGNKSSKYGSKFSSNHSGEGETYAEDFDAPASHASHSTNKYDNDFIDDDSNVEDEEESIEGCNEEESVDDGTVDGSVEIAHSENIYSTCTNNDDSGERKVDSIADYDAVPLRLHKDNDERKHDNDNEVENDNSDGSLRRSRNNKSSNDNDNNECERGGGEEEEDDDAGDDEEDENKDSDGDGYDNEELPDCLNAYSNNAHSLVHLLRGSTKKPKRIKKKRKKSKSSTEKLLKDSENLLERVGKNTHPLVSRPSSGKIRAFVAGSVILKSSSSSIPNGRNRSSNSNENVTVKTSNDKYLINNKINTNASTANNSRYSSGYGQGKIVQQSTYINNQHYLFYANLEEQERIYFGHKSIRK